jgi:hypothetical protein
MTQPSPARLNAAAVEDRTKRIDAIAAMRNLFEAYGQGRAVYDVECCFGDVVAELPERFGSIVHLLRSAPVETTRAPAPARPRAMARSIPALDPVTNATLPVRSKRVRRCHHLYSCLSTF